jgi:hypothetical protein
MKRITKTAEEPLRNVRFETWAPEYEARIYLKIMRTQEKPEGLSWLWNEGYTIVQV